MEAMIREFNAYLVGRGLRKSRPREVVAREFFQMSEHVEIEELFRRIQRISPGIGIATVYRTLNLLVESRLAVRREFATGSATYEKLSKRHHDHLLCTECGKIIEFHREEIEELQEKVASRHGFVLEFHKMELYGICKECRKKKPKKEKR